MERNFMSWLNQIKKHEAWNSKAHDKAKKIVRNKCQKPEGMMD